MSTAQQPSRGTPPPIALPAILIIAGIVLLLTNLGILPWTAWDSVWRLWPLVLIVIGLEVIIRGRAAWSSISAAVGVLAVIAVVGVIAVFASQVTGIAPSGGDPLRLVGLVGAPGNTVTEERDVANFTDIEIAGPLEVDIVRSDWFSTNVTADDNVIKNVVITQEGQRLRIRLEGLSFLRAPTVKVRVTMPDLRRVALSAAARGTIQGFESTNALDVNVSGASTLTGVIACGDSFIEVSGASKLTLEGSANNLRINVNGASRADLGNFAVNEANADLSGASSATVNASRRLDSNVSGASTLTYSGEPTLGRMETSGGSSVRHK